MIGKYDRLVGWMIGKYCKVLVKYLVTGSNWETHHPQAGKTNKRGVRQKGRVF